MQPKLLKICGAAIAFVGTGIAAPAFAQNDEMDGFEKRAQHIFATAYAEACDLNEMLKADASPEIFRTTFNIGDEDYPPRPFALLRFHCYYGAYNEMSVFYRVDDYGEIRQVQFAEPDLDITYVGGDYDGEVESITLNGFTTTDMLVNSTVQPDTLTVISWSKWRGIGDASSSGEWTFRDGEFVLISFDVDASYDGAVNPRRIYGEGPPGYGDE